MTVTGLIVKILFFFYLVEPAQSFHLHFSKFNYFDMLTNELL